MNNIKDHNRNDYHLPMTATEVIEHQKDMEIRRKELAKAIGKSQNEFINKVLVPIIERTHKILLERRLVPDDTD